MDNNYSLIDVKTSFLAKLLLWNTSLHVTQFFLSLLDRQTEHLCGITGNWLLSSFILGLLYTLPARFKLFSSLVAYVFYILVIAFNYFNDFHWHFFHSPFTYARLIEGGTRVFKYSAPSDEITHIWDGFLYANLIISLIAATGVFLKLPAVIARNTSSSRWHKCHFALAGVAALLFVFNKTARVDTLGGMLKDAPQFRTTEVAVRIAQHRPLRLSLPEKDFSPDPLVKLKSSNQRPNILFIDYEAVGSSYMSYYGSSAGLPMKNFAELTAHGMVSMRHYSVNGGASAGSDWSILTGLYLPNFGELPFQDTKWIQRKNLFSYFKQADYTTGAFYAWSSEYREYYKLFRHPDCDIFYDMNSSEFKSFPDSYTLEEKAMHLMFKEIDSIPDNKPFIFFYRTANAHWPYYSRQNFADTNSFERYKNAMRENDAVLGEIIRYMKFRDLFNKTIFVLTADHGEAFKQHDDLTGHSNGVYEELVRVPLIIAYPGHFPRPIILDKLTSHIDILPTILDMTEIARDDLAELEGYSLLHSLPENRTIFLSNGDDGIIAGVVQGDYKLIKKLYRDKDYLFNLRNDPAEKLDRSSQQPDITSALNALAKQWENHRRLGHGTSRYLDRLKFNQSSFMVAGNADIDIYHNGDKIASMSDSREVIIPISMQEGHNYIAVSGLVRYLGDNTGLHFRVLGTNSYIGTGGWWNYSTSPNLIHSRKWLDKTIDPADWSAPEMKQPSNEQYEQTWKADWIELPRKHPFVLRLDYNVVDGKLDVEQVRIHGIYNFRWFVNDKLYGRGEHLKKKESYVFSFPRLDLDHPNIRVDVSSKRTTYGLLMRGTLAGYSLDSNQKYWLCQGQNSSSNTWMTPEVIESFQVIGDWPPDAQWLWAPHQISGNVVFQLNPKQLPRPSDKDEQTIFDF